MEQITRWCAANGITKGNIPAVVSALEVHQDRDLVKQLLNGGVPANHLSTALKGVPANHLCTALQLMLGQSNEANILSLYEQYSNYEA